VPVYTLYKARTVGEVWREWDQGILGMPAVRELEERWGSRWRPSQKERTAFCRRKVVVDEVMRLKAQGKSVDDAITTLELLRNERSLWALTVDLLARRRGRGG